MKKRTSLLLAAILLFTSVFAHAGGSLTVATEGAYPPFNYIDDKGAPAGFDVDIALALCKAMDATCKVVTEPWVTILDGLKEKRYDFIVASMINTPERDKVADFTESYYRSRSIFIGKKELAAKAKGLEILAGKRIGTAKGTVQEKYLLDHYKNSTIVAYDDTAVMVDKFVEGDVDVILDGTLTGYEFLQTERGKPYDFVGEALDDSAMPDAACIAVGEGNAKLLADISDALKKIRIDGTYDRINRKYFPFSIY